MTTPVSAAVSQSDRVDALVGQVSRRRRLTIATPEGLELAVALALATERVLALLLDMTFWLGATIFLYFAGFFLMTQVEALRAAFTLITLLAFLVRNLYFIYFEMLWGGVTPGKRIVGLRVIDRSGGPLTPSAIVARNLTRELEIFLPISLFFSTGTGDWQSFLALTWTGLLAALPLFNAARMRAGDFIAGTIVIHLPKRILLDDLTATAAETRYRFAAHHLTRYGAFELQVLEEILRKPASGEADQLRADVAAKIMARIGWQDAVPPGDTVAFLSDFYTAQRAHLEREIAFGRVHADKTSRPQMPPPPPRPLR